MLRTALFALLLATLGACANAYVPTSDSADPIESKPPAETPFIERLIDRQRP